ncbi:hypothetical protein [Hyphomicrobium sp. MC1]|uniref:hypothetical protein n=1 Tax=Hyphomicrobium sp. (strain MC1) TaxID=717785 RepID=UPI000213EAD1|nr:hypothetical protein [Hyphomicrobium sp. MC1]CCB64072.1 protein of unknown function [Hyphomicrobium sp. MC1]
MSFDGKAFGEEVVAAVRALVDRDLGQILDRLQRVEGRLDRIDQRIDAVALRGVPAVDESAIVARVIDAVRPYVDVRVQEAFAEIPMLSAEAVRPLVEQEVCEAVERLKREKTANRLVASMVINRSGMLIAQTDDGEYRNLGAVAEPQSEAHWFDEAITLGVKALPAPAMRGGSDAASRPSHA